MLMTILKADLSRIYELTGQNHLVPTVARVFWHACSPRFAPIVLIRLAALFEHWKCGPISKMFSLVNFVVFGLEVATQCEIGPGLLLPHTQGTVIGALRIGPGATIFQNVTLGAKELDYQFSIQSRPVLGANVTIGSGAKVLGGLTIGNRSVVGANAVVLMSVPPDVVVGGIPARILRHRITVLVISDQNEEVVEPIAA